MPSTHVWKFFRIGGLDQVAIESGADLLALKDLDQKLWVALSCPVKGLELDEKTLAFIDTDHDGRIRAPEILGAIEWAHRHLKDVGDLLAKTDALPLTAFNDQTPEGRAFLASAKTILRGFGKADATTVALADAADTVKLFASTAFNGDGIITPDSASDDATRQVITDIIATVGGVPDRSGKIGIDQARADTFYAAASACIDWLARGESAEVLSLGNATAAAAAAIKAVRAKIDDFFARTRLATFDDRALAALNRSEGEYLSIAAKDLTITAQEIVDFPLARIHAGRTLPLFDAVNPAWADRLATLHEHAVAPVLGADKTELTEDDWTNLKDEVAAYDAWLAAKAGDVVEPLGPDRVKAILAGNTREAVNALLAQDRAVEAEFNAVHGVERLLRYTRDFRVLLENFVNFFDFYSPLRPAVFQAGVLYLDSRSTELCVQVTAPNPLAASSNVYLAYCDLKRSGQAMKIVAAFTQGDSDYLRVGRNGLFYDRKGRDWDATITSIVENPISIRQAFWTPYKKVARFVEDQIAKFAAAKEKAADASLVAGVTTTTTGARPADAKQTAFDVGKFAGIFAAIGLALGAIGGAIASVATGFMRLEWWQMPLAVFGALMLISGPSMLLAALKLRQRTLGPILDANGWAINGRVKINIPFGAKLTERARLPHGAKRDLSDPYSDKAAARRKKLVWLLVIVALTAAIYIRYERLQAGRYFWQAAAAPAAPAAPVAPAVEAAP